MFKLNIKFDADFLLYLLVILNVMATQYRGSLSGVLSPPLTSTVKSPLLTHVHSSPLSLTARLNQCHANCSCYINNGWIYSGQTLYNRLYSLIGYIHHSNSRRNSKTYGTINIKEIILVVRFFFHFENSRTRWSWQVSKSIQGKGTSNPQQMTHEV